MRSCPACSSSVPGSVEVCPRCGQDLAPDATVFSSSPSAPGTSSDFAPGTVIRGRYRIVALLGAGGMGEVYRADDLKLGQSVALKFLHKGLERDPERLKRLLEEVRTAREVTHANVCRVHDVDEHEGQHFLSMEYVDGEDLASLLRRIGRLPEERAVEVARQICAGLHAAHEAGVLHRDLKPANVMVDGRGRVRLTDFGLASLAADAHRNVKSGTPAYMAPEQIRGEGVSVASDIYALGLTLYELFTGRPVFEAQSAAEISSMHTSQMPSRPSVHVGSLDPAVESVVLRCLEKVPAARPASALAVAAGLPGGDPLAAALAAGETPSPELVADAGERDALPPVLALGLAALALGLVLAGSWWTATQSWIAWIPFEKRPEVLEDRARELLAEIGFTEDVYADPHDQAWGWLTWADVMRDVAERDSTASRWDAIRERPDVAAYWYRSSPNLLRPTPQGNAALTRGAVDLVDPPPLSAGEAMVVFDLDGRLRRVEVMPRRFTSEPAREPDWGPLFAAAGLDTARFREVEPRYQRYAAPDVRRAWVGTLAERPDVEYRVEAGASEGRPILFNFADAATLEGLAEPPKNTESSMLGILLAELPGVVILAIILLLFRLALSNSRQRRTDQRGAFRFAAFMFLLTGLSEGLRSHMIGSWEGWLTEVWTLVAASTFYATIVGMLYLAVEPVGRQVWPTMFVSSSRLLSREKPRLRDPLLGRSVLAGMIGGGVYFFFAYPVVRWLRTLDGGPAPWPYGIHIAMITDPSVALSHVLDVTMEVGIGFIMVSALVLIQRGLGRRRVAIAVALLVWTAISGFGDLESFVRAFALSAVMMGLLLRWGLLAMAVGLITIAQCWNARAIDYGAWMATGAVYALVYVILMAAYGAWAATGNTARAAR